MTEQIHGALTLDACALAVRVQGAGSAVVHTTKSQISSLEKKHRVSLSAKELVRAGRQD